MSDKYSKIEEKVEEGRRRNGVIEMSFESVLKCGDGKLGELLTWEIVSVKNSLNGSRLNVLEIKAKSSVVRFVLNGEKINIEKNFQNEFLDNSGQKESLSLRIR